MNIAEHLGLLLSKFDSFKLDSQYDRRLAIKPLYDFYQISILESSVMFCGFNRDTVKNQHLNTRWVLIKSPLSTIDSKIDRWNDLVKSVGNERSEVEHNDYHFPKRTALEKARLQAPDFLTWLVDASKEYQKISKGFSFAKEFSVLLDRHIIYANIIIDTYGEKPPFCVDMPEEIRAFQGLPSLKNRLEARNKKINDINDLKREDLVDLITLVRITENINARESALLSDNKCPKCGSKIITSQNLIGGNQDHPEPYAIDIRVGCEDCDYTLFEETNSL